MSMHEIESLIEDSVQLVAKSDLPASQKRDFLYNLYDFQNRFDTGYTHFRHIQTLLDLKFTYKIPLKEHPDFIRDKVYFENLNVEESHWLPSEIGREEDFVFAQQEEQGVFLYVDAGSAFWKRLCDAEVLTASASDTPEKLEPLTLVSLLLQESDKQKNIQLIREWLALIIHTIGYDLNAEDGIPDSFLDFINTKEALEIRSLSKRKQPFSEAYENDNWGYLTRPVLTDILKEETNIERLFKIRWLLDLDCDADTIIAEYKEATKPDPEREDKIQLLPDTIFDYLKNKEWIKKWEGKHEYGRKWLYHKQIKGRKGSFEDADLHMYVLLNADIDDMKIVTCKLGFQMGLLARWQGRAVQHEPEYIHFYDNLFNLLDKEEYETNKSLDGMGGWKFKIKNSEKTIIKHLNNLLDSFKKHAPKALALYEKPLSDFFEKNVNEGVEIRNHLKETHGFFLNNIELYIVFAFYQFEKGATKQAHKLADTAILMADTVVHPIKDEWIAAAQSIVNNKPKLNELLSFERNYW